MIQINLLPWREHARKARLLRFLYMLLAAFVCAVIFVIFIHLYYNNLIGIEKQRTAFLLAEIGQRQTELQNLKKQKQEQMTFTEQLHYVVKLQEKSFQAVRLLDQLGKATPVSLSLNKIKRSGNTITLEGQAKSDLKITLFMKNIAVIEGFKKPELTQIATEKKGSEEVTRFEMKVEQQP